jgi:hypothetical protein
MLMGIRRRIERAKACLKVLVDAAEWLTSHAPAAISAPSADRAIALAEIAGAAWAARDVIHHGRADLGKSPDPRFVAWLARRSSAWGGQLAPALMAASDGEMRTLLCEGAVPELQAGVQAGRPADEDWLVQPAYRIDHAAAFLAELNAAARPRSAAVHQARAEALDQQIANTSPSQTAHISAHAFAVHDLTGVYGPGGSAVRDTMLRFVATHPPGERATLQASKVAALLSDALGPRARVALLDQIIVLLGPVDGDPSVRMALARDSALVLLLLDADAVEPGGLTDVAMPITDTATGSSSPSPEHGRDQETSVDGGDAADDANNRGTDPIAEIAGEAERAIVAAVAERDARYQRAVDAGSLADALAIVRDAAADDDHEQAWSLLQDIARRHPDADPGRRPGHRRPGRPGSRGPRQRRRFRRARSRVLHRPVASPCAGRRCHRPRGPTPAQRRRPRYRALRQRDRAHLGGLTPNYLHDIVWCDRGAQVTLDTKGSMSAPMGRTMVAILTHALVDDRVPALVTGWIPALDDPMTRWGSVD